MTDIPLPGVGDTDWSDWGADEEAMSDIARTLNDMVLTGRLSQTTLDATYGQADKVTVAATGIAATNVRDALLEVLGYADDAGTYWSNSALTLNLTGLSYKADSDLNFPLAVGETAYFDHFLTVSGANAATANLSARIDGPAGVSAEWGPSLDWDAAGQGGTAKQALAGITDTRSFKLQTGATGIHIRGKVWGATAAGNVVLNLAPFTTVASGPPIRNAGSRVVVDRLLP